MKQLIFHKEKKKIAGINSKEEKKNTTLRRHYNSTSLYRPFFSFGQFRIFASLWKANILMCFGPFVPTEHCSDIFASATRERITCWTYIYKVRMIIILLLLFVWSLLRSVLSAQRSQWSWLQHIFSMAFLSLCVLFCLKCKRKTIKIKIQGLNL